MAGVTNVAFRVLCREQEIAQTGTVSGLYVCEMVTARALVERNPKTLHMTTFAPKNSRAHCSCTPSIRSTRTRRPK